MGSGFMGPFIAPQIYGAGVYGAIWDPIDLWGQGLWGHLLPHRFGVGFMGLGFMGPFGTP